MKDKRDSGHAGESKQQFQQLYRIKTIMELLEVSHATVYRMIANGQLDVVRISKRASRVTGESLHRLLGTKDQ